MITPEILTAFKERMHLGDDEDDNLLRILNASHEDLQKRCGNYSMEQSDSFKELVFERARYAYNDALEYFYFNFLTQMNNLSLDSALKDPLYEEE
ncbi:hypothetical protein [Mangrovibacillus cuniculi]|uniref:Phage gp6-like head-tail connector protein n=1 Tax=Mangrovibacillus cuniculi TaxID=2593652 RepID=A0A7S8CC73_9BACI|nr:hypothetical protein [Mangrovibacillus cuniculi]QPC47113.1 hypothetical protein G8O30_09105 [Mangrovibacillus cuniculi]